MDWRNRIIMDHTAAFFIRLRTGPIWTWWLAKSSLPVIALFRNEEALNGLVSCYIPIAIGMQGVREIEEWMSRTSGIPLETLRQYLFLFKDRDATSHLLRWTPSYCFACVFARRLLACSCQSWSTVHGRFVNLVILCTESLRELLNVWVPIRWSCSLWWKPSLVDPSRKYDRRKVWSYHTGDLLLCRCQWCFKELSVAAFWKWGSLDSLTDLHQKSQVGRVLA